MLRQQKFPDLPEVCGVSIAVKKISNSNRVQLQSFVFQHDFIKQLFYL